MKTIYVSQKDNRSWSTSPDAFEGLTYLVTVPEEFTGGAMTYNRFTGEWVPDTPYVRTHEDDVNDAIAMVQQLKTEAADVVLMLDLDFRLGDISDEDLQRLKAWREYMKELSVIDFDKAPDITYPDKPE